MQETSLQTNTIGREIADILLAVNRAYSKSDYIHVLLGEEQLDSVRTWKLEQKLN